MSLATGALGGAANIAKAQQLLEQGPQQLQGFEQVLQDLQQQHGAQADQMLQQAADASGKGLEIQVTTAAQAEGLYAQKLEQAREPGGVEKLLGEVESGFGRIQGILDELHGGKTFRTQEIIGLQAELQTVSLNVEITTKVVGELVSSVKQVMQQQL